MTSHSEKALSPMLVTLLGMDIVFKALHSEKAPAPMLITVVGIVKLEIFVQPLKQLSPIIEQPFSIVT
jgi:hypothetical protein